MLNVLKNVSIKHTNTFTPIFWDPMIKKLRKKYIGKHLPYPFFFDITIRNEK